MLAKLWLKVTFSSVISFTGHSSAKVVGFWGHFRRLVASTLDVEDTIIGGQDVIVEVDESKLVQKNYNRGHRVEGVWVEVGVERTDARKVFIVPVERRDAETLTAIIKDCVVSGSKVFTDGWKGYGCVDDDQDYERCTINHSIEFRDSQTGVHTNTVEGINSGIKRRIAVRSRVREGIEEHLDEFVWRRKHEEENLWEYFMDAIRDIHYDQ